MAKELYVSDMPNHFIKNIASTFLLRKITPGQTVENKRTYCDVLLADATGTIRGVLWDAHMKDGIDQMEGRVVSVKALVAKGTDGTCELVIHEMQEVTDYVMTDYINGLTEEEGGRYEALLHKYIESIKDAFYRSVVSFVYRDFQNLKLLPASMTGHHSFGGGFLVYTVSVTCLANHMLVSLGRYDQNPAYRIPYNPDLLIAGALLHAVGTVRMLTPPPDTRRIPESIPLTLYDLTLREIQRAVDAQPELANEPEKYSLLLHMVGCAHKDKGHKPMLREGILLRQAVLLHEHISFLERFICKNKDKEGILYDDDLGNYLYVNPKKEEP